MMKSQLEANSDLGVVNIAHFHFPCKKSKLSHRMYLTSFQDYK